MIPEGPLGIFEVGPGFVRLGRHDLARSERSSEREQKRKANRARDAAIAGSPDAELEKLLHRQQDLAESLSSAEYEYLQRRTEWHALLASIRLLKKRSGDLWRDAMADESATTPVSVPITDESGTVWVEQPSAFRWSWAILTLKIDQQDRAREQTLDELDALRKRIKKAERLRSEVASKIKVARKAKKPVRKGRIQSFSNESRARLRKRIAGLDSGPLFDESGSDGFALLTFTLPLCGWTGIISSQDDLLDKLDSWRRRFKRNYGFVFRGVWKRETTSAGVVHVHVLSSIPAAAGRKGLDFATWAKLAWAAVINHPDLTVRAKHEMYGVDVRELGTDSRTTRTQISAYFANYATAKGSKEYQNRMPDGFRESRGGRVWGVWGLKDGSKRIYTDEHFWAFTLRVLRKIARAKQVKKGQFKKRQRVWVEVIDYKTGEIARKRVCRSTNYIRTGGGKIFVSDGPKLAFEIGRAYQIYST